MAFSVMHNGDNFTSKRYRRQKQGEGVDSAVFVSASYPFCFLIVMMQANEWKVQGDTSPALTKLHDYNLITNLKQKGDCSTMWHKDELPQISVEYFVNGKEMKRVLTGAPGQIIES